MASRSNSVTILPGRAREGRPWAASSNPRLVAVTHLDDLIVDLERLSQELDWSSWRWKIASTPCRMRICILRNTLREVVLSSPAGEQGAIRWILEADSASREIERWSNEMNARFQVLQCSDGDFAGRKRDLEMLLAGRSELIGVLGLARKLISQRISPSREAYASSYSDLVGTLRSFDRQLRIMVETYEEIPRAIDEALGDAADNVVNPEKVVIELHRLMRTSVFAEYSPLRANPNLWDAFVQQQDEFISFYKSAYSALEIYAEVLQAYSLRRLTEEKPSKHGGLEKICQDKSVQVRERNSCIEAIGYLYGKFSAMLMVL